MNLAYNEIVYLIVFIIKKWKNLWFHGGMRIVTETKKEVNAEMHLLLYVIGN